MDPELGDLATVGRTELERVMVRRLEVGDAAGARTLAQELGRRYEAQGSVIQ